jgi:hypothetical protein
MCFSFLLSGPSVGVQLSHRPAKSPYAYPLASRLKRLDFHDGTSTAQLRQIGSQFADSSIAEGT